MKGEDQQQQQQQVQSPSAESVAKGNCLLQEDEEGAPSSSNGQCGLNDTKATSASNGGHRLSMDATVALDQVLEEQVLEMAMDNNNGTFHKEKLKEPQTPGKWMAEVDETAGKGQGKRTGKRATMLSEIREHKIRFVKSCGLYSCFITIGLSLGIVGPTLIDLMFQTNSDLTTTSLVLPCRAGGYALGSFVSGIFYDKMNQLKLTIVTMLFSAALTLTIPFMSDIYVVLTIFLFLGLCLGLFETGGNMFLIHLWGKENPPFMQALHFFYGLGAFIAPMIAAPFLTDSGGVNIHGGGNSECGSSTSSSNLTLTTPSPSGNETHVLVTNLQYPYGIVGCYSIFNALIFIALWRFFPKTPAHPTRLICVSDSVIQSATASFAKGRVNSFSGHVAPTSDDFDTVASVNHCPEQDDASGPARRRNRHNSSVSVASVDPAAPAGANGKIGLFSRQTSTVSTAIVSVGGCNLLKSVTTSNAINSLAKQQSQGQGQGLGSSSSSNTCGRGHGRNKSVVLSLKDFPLASISNGQLVMAGGDGTADPDPSTGKWTEESAGEATRPSPERSTRKSATIGSRILRSLSLDNPWRTGVVALSVAFMHIYYGLEITFGSFLTTYTAKSDLHLDTKVGAQLTSLFWATFTFWRLITIFYINYTGSQNAIFISLAIMLFGNCVLVPFGNVYEWSLWTGTATIGVGISSIWASMFGFLEVYFPVTSKIASSMITAAMVGEFIFPVIIAKYVDCHPTVFAWVTLTCSLAITVLFIVIVIICRFKIKPSPSTRSPESAIAH